MAAIDHNTIVELNSLTMTSGSAFASQEHTVINVGHPDGPPRLVSLFLMSPSNCFLQNSKKFERKLGKSDSCANIQISCVRAAQGFEWNQG